MKRQSKSWRRACMAVLLLTSVGADAEIPPFDYWVLALSWSPEWCATQAVDADKAQCSASRGFIVHGLWPQFPSDRPEYCAVSAPVPDAVVERIAPLIPSAELVEHEWNKHGTCSALSAEAYFASIETAMARLKIPEDFLRRRANQRISITHLEQAFLDANPGLGAEALTIECRSHYLTEVRVCLDRELQPRACAKDVGDVCGREIIIRPQ